MHQEIKDRIVQILSDVVERSKAINQTSGTPLNLEIDLIMEDLRLLYRDFESLRKKISTIEDFPVSMAPEPQKQELKEATDLSQSSGLESQAILEPSPAHAGVIPAEKSNLILKNDIEVHRPAASDPVKAAAPSAMAVNLESNLKDQAVVAGTETQNPMASNLGNPVSGVSPSILKPTANISAPGITNTRIADRFAATDNTLHKRLAAQKEDRSLGVRLQMTPINNLKEAIGVNEKFLFINELFGGNIQVYNEAIAKLNSFQNIDQSFEYLNDLGKTHEWDESQSAQTIEMLAGFVMRRYLVR